MPNSSKMNTTKWATAFFFKLICVTVDVRPQRFENFNPYEIEINPGRPASEGKHLSGFDAVFAAGDGALYILPGRILFV